MPNSSKTVRQRWMRLTRKRTRRHLRRKRLKQECRVIKSGFIPEKLPKLPRISAPTVFSLGDYRNRRNVIRFLKILREICIKKRHAVQIDFFGTEKMVSCGTLLFLAEVQRIVAITRKRPIHCCRILNSKVRQVLQQIGFFDAIGRKRNLVPTSEDVIHWRAISGVGAEGKKASELVETMKGRLPPLLSSPMYDGLVEAMTNCTQHAYLEPRYDGFGLHGNGEWWMFAMQRDGNLMVVICDLGIRDTKIFTIDAYEKYCCRVVGESRACDGHGVQ